MSRLSFVQDSFQSFVLSGDDAIRDQVVGTQRVPVATRLAIYGDAYRSRLVEALEANFPALAKLLGEEDFQTLGSEYVSHHESSSFSIRYYGHALAELLGTDPQYVAAPVLSELARWEWAMTEVFDAGDADPIGADALSQVPPEHWAEVCFDWHPSVRSLALSWNVPQIWKAVTTDADRPEASLLSEPVQWLLWRHELNTYFRSLPAAESAAVAASRSGAPFGEICALLCEHFEEDEAPAQAALFLRQWIGSGLIVAAHPP